MSKVNYGARRVGWRRGGTVVVAAISLVAGLASAAGPAAAQVTSPIGLPDSVVQQITAIEADKAARTPAQQKIGSSLIYQARAANGQRAVAAAPALRTSTARAADGRVSVDINATVTDRLQALIASLGGTVVNSVPSLGAVRALLPLGQIEALAA